VTAAGRPLPRRSFGRIRRSEFDDVIASLERQRDRALAARRAHADRVAALLEQVADAHTLDAQHAATSAERRLAHRMTADALRDLARDVERGLG
jgi:bifunctional DNase/RNase